MNAKIIHLVCWLITLIGGVVLIGAVAALSSVSACLPLVWQLPTPSSAGCLRLSQRHSLLPPLPPLLVWIGMCATA